MPMYVFQHLDGTEIEEFFPMEKHPALGETIWRDGRPYVRVPTVPGATVTHGAHTSWSLGRHDLERLGHKNFDANGCGVFTSQRQVDETVARSQDTPTPLTNVR